MCGCGRSSSASRGDGAADFPALARLAASCFSEIGIRGHYGGWFLSWVWMLMVLLGEIGSTLKMGWL